MPELPEVETIVRGLAAVLPGRIIARARLSAPDLYRTGSRRVSWVNGGRVRAVERFGKALHFRIDAPGGAGERAVVVGLGMTGKFLFVEGAGRVDPGLRRHRHGRWVFEDGSELHYIDPRRFGYFYVGSPDGLGATLNIGPDPFQIRPRALRDILGRRDAPIKALLLNQRLIAGIGNIYVDELLFRVGIHPESPGRVVAARAGEILTSARTILRRAIRFNGTTISDYRDAGGGSGRFQLKLAVYGRDGEPCRRCGSTIRKLVVSGRGTHVCPSCQRRPRVRRRR